MRIAVNTRLLLKNKLDGIGWFSFETLRRMTINNPEHEFIFIFDRSYHSDFIFSENIKPVVLFPPARHPFLWYLWFEWALPFVLRREKADIFVSPDGYLSLRTSIPQVNVIHDINFFHRPDDLPFFSRKYYNYYFPKFAEKANRIGTVSEYSREDISANYHISKQKIEVLYNGANEIYKPLDHKVIHQTQEEISNGTPYFVFIGTLHPRKNIPGLLRAFDLFRERSGIDQKLVIVGERFFLTSAIDEALQSMKFHADVIFTGRLDPDRLHKVLGSSTALCFVPYFEGFGIPMVEAMKCGVPVIASNVTSLPEVAGDAALYAAPDDSDKIADNMIRICKEDELRRKMSELSLKRSRYYSWDKTAERFWSLIEKTFNDA